MVEFNKNQISANGFFFFFVHRSRHRLLRGFLVPRLSPPSPLFFLPVLVHFTPNPPQKTRFLFLLYLRLCRRVVSFDYDEGSPSCIGFIQNFILILKRSVLPSSHPRDPSRYRTRFQVSKVPRVTETLDIYGTEYKDNRQITYPIGLKRVETEGLLGRNVTLVPTPETGTGVSTTVTVDSRMTDEGRSQVVGTKEKGPTGTRSR